MTQKKQPNKKGYFSGINFNKHWSEKDWEKYFQAQDAYFLSEDEKDSKTKPLSRIRFEGNDEVKAFEPVLKAYGHTGFIAKIPEHNGRKFFGDDNPDEDYYPTTEEDHHFWKEGVPLGTLLISLSDLWII